MIKAVPFSLLLAILSAASAEGQLRHDIVYLNDGSIIRGKFDTNAYGRPTLHQLGGSLTVIERDQINKVVGKRHYYSNFSSTGFIIGSALNEKPVVLSILSEFNIQLFNYFALGVMSGMELLYETTIPVACAGKVYFPLQRNTLYLSSSFGYSFSADKPEFFDYHKVTAAKGGYLAGTGLGMIVPLNYRNGLFFELGYRYNELEYNYNKWESQNVTRMYYYHRLHIRFGLVLY